MLSLDIIYILKEADQIPAEELARKCNTSAAKVREEIRFLNDDLDDMAKIVSRSGSGNGFRLEVYDKDAFFDYVKDLEKQHYTSNMDLHSQLSRTENICLYLLEQNDYIKLDKLADHFYLSSRQMSDDLKIVRTYLSNYSIEIRNRPHYGLKAEGEEFNKRLCIANILLKNISADLFNKDSSISDAEVNEQMNLIRTIIETEGEKRKVEFSDVALQNLVVHVFVTLERARRGMNQTKIDGLTIYETDDLSKVILEKISKKTGVKFNEYDQQYLGIHIAGKRIYSDQENLISTEIRDLSKDILKKIDERFLTDYQNNEELNTRFALHLIPLIIRIKNHLASSNPLAESIKGEYKVSNEMAVVAADEINRRYGVQLSQDEISYIALHLELSSYMSRLKKYKLLLICHTGTASSKILEQQLLMRFGDYIAKLDTSSVNMISRFDLDSYDLILTTVPFRAFTKTPIHQISSFLDQNNSEEISGILRNGAKGQDLSQYFSEDLFFSGIKVGNKEEVISFMVEKIREKKEISSHFYDSVMEREALSSTDYGNRVAIPHPFRKMSDEAFTCVCVLEKEIRWGINNVQVVMLTSISDETKNMQTYYYLLTKLIASEERIDKLIKNPTFENFMKLLNQQ